MSSVMLQGHVLELLGDIPDEFFDCVITSPPYYGLRSYDVPPVIWDGEDGCCHQWGSEMPEHHPGQVEQTKWKSADAAGKGQTAKSGQFCSLCGAWRGSLGLEPTYQLYISHLMQIFREVYRVLKKTGTCWVNIGDSYASSGGASRHFGYQDPKYKNGRDGSYEEPTAYPQDKVQPKSLIQIPERFSIAMTDAGWIKRNTMIWHKPNAMPSSAKDRFTVDFEYVYFFTKDKKYWFEQQFEPHLTQENRPDGIVRNRIFEYDSKENKMRGFKTKPNDKSCGHPYFHGKDVNYGEKGRNKRTVWTIPTKPCPEAHFAVFPDTLVKPMLNAGCPVDGWVLDPFAGIGTVGTVAKEQGKNFIGVELSQAYCQMVERRIENGT